MSRQKHQPWQQVKTANKIVIESITQTGNDLTVNLEVIDPSIDVIKVDITSTVEEEVPTVPEAIIEPKKSNKKVSNLLNEKN